MRTLIVLKPPVGIVQISDPQARYLVALLKKNEDYLRWDVRDHTVTSAEKNRWVEYFHVGNRCGYRLTKSGRGIAQELVKQEAAATP